MEHNDQNRSSEQKTPDDVLPTPGDAASTSRSDAVDDDAFIAPTFVTPSSIKETGDRPLVNPVTGGAL